MRRRLHISLVVGQVVVSGMRILGCFSRVWRSFLFEGGMWVSKGEELSTPFPPVEESYEDVLLRPFRHPFGS